MSFLWLTIPATFLLSAALLGLAIWAVLAGDFDDPELPALRLQLDDDRIPEHEPRDAPGPRAPGRPAALVAEQGCVDR